MKYVLATFHDDDISTYSVVHSLEDLLEKIVILTREDAKFSVHQIGDCILDES